MALEVVGPLPYAVGDLDRVRDPELKQPKGHRANTMFSIKPDFYDWRNLGGPQVWCWEASAAPDPFPPPPKVVWPR